MTCADNDRNIHHEGEDWIEKSVPRITDWHHKACRVMTNVDHKGRIFQSHPYMNNGCFFLLTTKYLERTWKRLSGNPEYAEMRHGDVIWTLQRRHGSVWGCSCFLSFSRAGRDCEIEISHIGKINGNPIWCARKIESFIGVQWGQKNPDLRAYCSSGKWGLPSLPLNGGPEGWDFSGTTEHQWSILFLIYQTVRYSTV